MWLLTCLPSRSVAQSGNSILAASRVEVSFRASTGWHSLPEHLQETIILLALQQEKSAFGSSIVGVNRAWRAACLKRVRLLGLGQERSTLMLKTAMQLSSLSAIQAVDLSACFAMHPSDMAGLDLPNLRGLRLPRMSRKSCTGQACASALCSWLPVLKELRSLSQLDISFFIVSSESIGKLRGLPHLRALNMSHCVGIGCSGANWKSAWSELAYGPGLRSLDVSYSGFGRYNALLALVSLHSLTRLSLEGCAITRRGLQLLAHLPALTKLSLASCKSMASRVDAILWPYKLRSLSVLDLSGIPVPTRQLVALKSAYPYLTIVSSQPEVQNASIGSFLSKISVGSNSPKAHDN